MEINQFMKKYESLDFQIKETNCELELCSKVPPTTSISSSVVF